MYVYLHRLLMESKYEHDVIKFSWKTAKEIHFIITLYAVRLDTASDSQLTYNQISQHFSLKFNNLFPILWVFLSIISTFVSNVLAFSQWRHLDEWNDRFYFLFAVRTLVVFFSLNRSLTERMIHYVKGKKIYSYIRKQFKVEISSAPGKTL